VLVADESGDEHDSGNDEQHAGERTRGHRLA
jgi:hypothetical protein